MQWMKQWYSIVIIVSLSVIAALLMYIFYETAEPRSVKLTHEEWEWLEANDGRIRIGADIDYIPFDFINQGGEHDGIAEDYFRLIEIKLNIRFKRINAGSWVELLEMAEKGDVDLIKCIVKSPERSDYFHFTHPYLSIPSVIVGRCGHGGDSFTLKDLKGKRVAVNDRYYMHEIIKTGYPEIELVPVENNSKLFEALSTGTVDYAVSDMPVVTYFVKNYGIANLKIAGHTGEFQNLAAAGRKELVMLNSILSKTVDSITEEERESIASRWITVEYRRYLYSRGIFIAVLTGLSVLIAVAFVIGLWNKSLHMLVKRKTEELEKYKGSLEEQVEERTRQLRETNRELENALASVKTLSGLLPICSNCKKIRNDKGYWEQIELYVSEHTNADFSHSICPDCAAELYPEYMKKK